MFKECFSEQFPRISACSQLRKSWHKWFFDPMLYQPPLARDHLCRKHMYLIQPTTMSVFHVNSQKPMQWEDTAFFLLQNMQFFTSKYAFIAIMLVKMIPLFFLVIHWVPTWSWTLYSLTLNWPTLPLIFFFPHALTTGSRFVSQREALYQEEGSFLTWMNSLTKLAAN